MKSFIDALIVVEGVTDVQFLGSFLDAEFVSTNGSAILPSCLDLIEAAISKGKQVIVLTDPDSPGEKIRTSIAAQFPNVMHAFIPKSLAVAHGKLGVAQASKETILNALKHTIRPSQVKTAKLEPHMLVALGIIGNDQSKAIRKQVIDHFHLGHCNVKTMVKRLNFLGIGYDELAAWIQST
jgi:ribonuclease M5